MTTPAHDNGAYDKPITEFTIKAERYAVSVLLRIRPNPSTVKGNDREWDEQAAIRTRIDPMLARHIGQRLIDQADLADAFRPGEAERDHAR